MSELIAALERAEMDAFTDLYRAASTDVVAAAGLSVEPIADGVLLAASCIDVLALNRLVGLGLRAQPSESTLTAALRVVAATRAPRVFVQVAPVDGHESVAARLEQLGLRHYNDWMHLRRDLRNLEELPAPSPELAVREIGPSDASAFGRIVSTAFGYPAAIAPLVTQNIGRAHWRHYLALHDDVPIAAAAMYVSTQTAWFGFAATDEAHRRRGAQRALVVRRLRDAADAGCQWVSVETAEDTVTRDAPSFRNLRRLGFEVAYRRANYLWSQVAKA